MATRSIPATLLSKLTPLLSKLWKPHKYQKKAVKFLLAHEAAALLLDPGLGKTSITYAAQKVLQNRGLSKGMLVLAPLRPVYSVWPQQKEEWKDFSGFKVGILHGDDKDYVLEGDYDVFVMNYEGIEWLFGTKGPIKPSAKSLLLLSKKEAAEKLAAFERRNEAWKAEMKLVRARLKLLFAKVDTLVFDELSKMKNPDSGRYKNIKPHLHKFARRWGLTGSPAPNGLMDLFGQAYVLDLGRALGQFVTHYRNRFFYSTGFGGYTWVPQEDAPKKIYAAMKTLALRMDANDYLEMPTLIPVPIYVELDAKSRKAYDEMEDELFTTMDAQEFVAGSAAASSMKCHQIANGAIYEDKVDPLTGLPRAGKRKWTAVHTAKILALEELIGELQGQPLLCAYHFGHDLERIVKHFGKDTPHMDVSAKRADELINAWNANELEYLFGHPASMGHGLNMQGGDAYNVCFFSLPWDYEMYDQFIRRLLRQGNKAKRIFVYHIIVKGTVDEAIMRALHNKHTDQKALLDALNTYRKGRR